MASAPEFTDHAKARMAERSVTREEALLTVNNPDRINPGEYGTTNYYRNLNGRVVRVTVGPDLHDASKRWVVTVAVRES